MRRYVSQLICLQGAFLFSQILISDIYNSIILILTQRDIKLAQLSHAADLVSRITARLLPSVALQRTDETQMMSHVRHE